jgi:nitrous oxidase accessory protein NosD
MTQGFQRFTKRYVNVLGVLIGLAVVGSILFYSGCGMTSSPKTPTNPTPTPTPTPAPDTTPPTSTITSPTKGAFLAVLKPVDITGTASDAGGGSVAKVEVSVNGGANYSAATGTNAWSITLTPVAPGATKILSRAVDNSGNVQNPPAEIFVIVDNPPTSKITSPTEGATVVAGIPVDITGTASDCCGGLVFKVEVSVDGGANYSRAIGLDAWSFKWTPSAPGPATIKSRAVDDIGFVQNPPTEITVTVRPPIKVPSDQSTIQSAIDVATNGDTVLVAPGTYPEHIDFKGKAITVTSESGPQDTIIDAGNADSVVFFISGEGRGSILNGFTLQNGRPPSTRSPEGGGILIQRSSSPKITNNIITNNHACNGAGIAIFSGSPLIQLNTITGNINDVCDIGGGGGGIYIVGAGSPEILDNEISDNVNAAGGGIFMFGGKTTPIIKRNVIKGNRVPVPGHGGGEGGGIYMVNEVEALIVQNLITGNQAVTGGGIYSSVGKSVLINNTIADNEGPINGSGILAFGSSGFQLTNNIIVAKPGQSALYCNSIGVPVTRFNNIFSASGPAYDGACSDRTRMDGNISADPQFIAPTQGDYHLHQVSPSIDAGDNQAPNLPDMDLDGNPRILDGDGDRTATIDMGVDEFLLPPFFTRPISKITSPKAGGTVATENTVSITGLARDAGGGTVDRVEVSVDGGATWNLATGKTAWSYDWTPDMAGLATIKSRAVDDSGNQQDPPAEITVTVRIPVIIRVPSEQGTIQAAINAADYGDKVLVAPGNYPEHIDFKGKAITVTSENGPDVTTIDGGDTAPVVLFISGEGRNSTLNGFTLQKGRAGIGNPPVIEGGGVKVQGSSPTITNNLITNNHACYGGGIGIRFGSPLIRRNKITNNDSNLCSLGGGSGISVQGTSSVEILDNEISNNGIGAFQLASSGGGIYIFGAGTPIVKRNIIKGNQVSDGRGGGILLANESEALIVQNLITGNQAYVGAGLYLVARGAHGAMLVNNTIADNDSTSNGSGIFAEGFGIQPELTNNIIVPKPGRFGLYCGDLIGQNPPIVRSNNIYSVDGMAYGGSCADMTGTNGNINADPLFTNTAQGDYHLQQGSPSIDTGDNQAPNLPDMDLDGNPRILDGNGDGDPIVDMGVDEFLAPTSFGISLQLDRRNRMRLESQVRFCEGVGVRFPRATRLFVGGITAGYQFKGQESK